jgi:hypothetical protein
MRNEESGEGVRSNTGLTQLGNRKEELGGRGRRKIIVKGK